jgi:hypothetical protein
LRIQRNVCDKVSTAKTVEMVVKRESAFADAASLESFARRDAGQRVRAGIRQKALL